MMMDFSKIGPLKVQHKSDRTYILKHSLNGNFFFN